jgi:hypothetical protein
MAKTGELKDVPESLPQVCQVSGAGRQGIERQRTEVRVYIILPKFSID